MDRKKKIVYHSDSSLSKTGFGRCTKEVLTYLHKTGKYDIVEYACSKAWQADPEHNRKPWKSFGSVPDTMTELNAIAPDDARKRMVAYGSHFINKIIYQEKPDVYFGVQDPWGLDYAVDKDWYNKISSVFWVTLDSLPILKNALEIAPKVKNFWVWSKFAEEAMHELGHTHVRTVHGAIDASRFYRLTNEQKASLRKNFQIPLEAFVVGFVFRNQPRKSVPNLIEGFQMFKQMNPFVKHPRLLLHTHWNEGWRIHEFADEFKVPHHEIITTYVCTQCRSYRVQEYKGEGVGCPYCGKENGFVTTNPAIGVSEEQLNEVYNLMDVYCHPFTSGGQEIPVQEAKFTELITLVTDYSCGKEMCQQEAGSFALEWQEYREPDSQFIKATTSAYSIAKQITKVLKFNPKERERLGKQAREWALNNYSSQAIGKIIEDFIDSCPFTTYDFQEPQEVFNPSAQIDANLSNEEWVLQLYSRILGRQVDKYDSGVRQWLSQLKRGGNRGDIENFFRQTAMQHKQVQVKNQMFEKIKAQPNKKLLYVIPASERDVFLSTALFKSIKEQYPDYKLYVATEFQYRGALDANPYVDEVLPYVQEMDNLTFLEGTGSHKGFFDIAFLPYVHTQRIISYIHNGLTKIAYGSCIKY